MYLKVPRDMKKGEYGWFELVQSPEEILRAIREGRITDWDTGEEVKIMGKDYPAAKLCHGEDDGGADWMDGYSEGYENGKLNGRLEILQSFLTVPLDTEVSFELSEKGREVYRKGLWRTLRTFYGSYIHMMPNDRLTLTMNFVGFAKIFGPYIRKHGTEAFADLIKDRAVRISEVRLKFDAHKLIDIREVTLSDEVL
jgi:hypothetical protein